ncbi:MAG: LD-carboxypeptidase [Armatimonadetes bacterium]|nr:LD-carboxypeptidase [Armatimonadota bacterium]
MRRPRWPTPLLPGMTIGIASPAGPVTADSLDRGLRRLHTLGFETRPGPHARDRWHYLAGSDADRAADLQALWSDPEVDAVWCARGGYGAMRLLPLVDWQRLARPIPLIGYSDITALQLALYRHHRLVSFSGPMISTSHGYGHPESVDHHTETDLWSWLRPGPLPRQLANPPELPLRVLREGRAEGPLLGGNLSLVAALVGTPYLPDFHGAILVIEDIGEAPYRVDRMLTQLALAGILDQIAGVVIGDFADYQPPPEPDPGPPVAELVLERLGDRDLPVLADLTYGHLPRRCTVPLGAWCRLETDGPSLLCDGEPTA